jgi:hypothetical protein
VSISLTGIAFYYFNSNPNLFSAFSLFSKLAHKKVERLKKARFYLNKSGRLEKDKGLNKSNKKQFKSNTSTLVNSSKRLETGRSWAFITIIVSPNRKLKIVIKIFEKTCGRRQSSALVPVRPCSTGRTA